MVPYPCIEWEVELERRRKEMVITEEMEVLRLAEEMIPGAGLCKEPIGNVLAIEKVRTRVGLRADLMHLPLLPDFAFADLLKRLVVPASANQ